MKWTVKLVTEVVPGKPIEEEVTTIERENLVSRCTINPDFGSAAGFTAFKSQTEAASCA